jgi:hypothetical protein
MKTYKKEIKDKYNKPHVSGDVGLPYKVYTALLTQSGGDVPQKAGNKDNGSLVVGVTYEISNYEAGDDFTNVGAPSNANGVKFVATGTTAENWSGATELNYNNGAPIVKVLENTIGNVWFTYDGVGNYKGYSNGLFDFDKTILMTKAAQFMEDPTSLYNITIDGPSNNIIYINNYFNYVLSDSFFTSMPIEIRVYN